jgi:elongation factor Ts
MEITTEQIKSLRDKTGISVMQCRKALEDSNGDSEKALMLLKKKGADVASKKADRVIKAGRIAGYVHGIGTVGAMIELSSETDFVSKHEDFAKLAYDIAMQIAATKPEYLKRDEVPQEEISKLSEIFKAELEGKPEEIKEKILKGKLDSYYKEKVLLEQDFIKDPSVTILGLIEAAIQKFGEKIEIARFVRFGVLGK